MPGMMKETICVGLDDPFPHELFELLCALPVDDERRPIKRVKTEHSDIEHICLGRHQIKVERVAQINPDARHPPSTRRSNVSRHLAFTIKHSNNNKTQALTLKLWSRSVPNIEITTSDNAINRLCKAATSLADRRNTGADYDKRPGCPWLYTTLELLIDGNRAIFLVDFEIRWTNSLRAPRIPSHKSLDQYASAVTLGHFFSEHKHHQMGDPSKTLSPWSPSEFYDAAFTPPPHDVPQRISKVPLLDADLYPFQARTLHWLLEREGVKWTTTNRHGLAKLGPVKEKDGQSLPMFFFEATDADRGKIYASHVFKVVMRDIDMVRRFESNIKGGILAEEMGLGKTVEMISLILLHQRPGYPATTLDEDSLTMVRPTSATLIVTPPALRDQWLSELAKHASHLKVMAYPGIKKARSEEKVAELVDEMARSDAVVATYPDLGAELNRAEEPPARSLRNRKREARPKSPLMQLSWWRLCLDEAQMVDNGVSKFARLAQMIPRVNSWAVTGTPVKDDVDDLQGLLLFLRYPLISDKKVWQYLSTECKPSFRALFSRIALRHSKAGVRNELHLPPQHRFVISMPLNAVEEQYYQAVFDQVVAQCGLDAQGDPTAADWDPDDPSVVASMRRALDSLRQAALHPEIGSLTNQRYAAPGSRVGPPMRTVAEVLDAMIRNSEVAIRSDLRNLLMMNLSRGQLLENSPRVREALRLWEHVRTEARQLVQEDRTQVGQIEKESRFAKGEDETQRVGQFRQKLRLSLELLHRSAFFCANAYFQIKTDPEMTDPTSAAHHELGRKEEESYREAKSIRREMLNGPRGKANKWMDKVAALAKTKPFAVIPELEISGLRGMETSGVHDRLEDLFAVLNEQANLLDNWREEIIRLLMLPLVDEEDDVDMTGEEYTDSTKIQEEMLAHLIAMKAVVADRQHGVAGLTNNLVEHDTNLAARQAERDEGPVPEKMMALLRARKTYQSGIAIRGSMTKAIAELREIIAFLKDRRGPERIQTEITFAQLIFTQTQEQLAAQRKVIPALEKEVADFTDAMNARIEYYRQLQHISDQVNAYDGDAEEDGQVGWLSLLAEEQALDIKLRAAQSKHRYLLHLKETESDPKEQRLCIICRENFSTGLLTVCGHKFCKGCIITWFKTHHNCPVCKRSLHSADLYPITLKPKALNMHSDSLDGGRRTGNNTGESSSASPEKSSNSSEANAQSGGDGNSDGNRKRPSIYQSFNQAQLTEIHNIDLPGPSFTTKVGNLVRHILWLRDEDPGSKSILFSQYSEFLDVMASAFTRHKIGFASMTGSDRSGVEQFKNDPGIEVFLLHARAHASGLNLVNANNVFLCEPLMNTALELQAIARVDRIGQRHGTSVWLYVVEGTVEESIYERGVGRRMGHVVGSEGTRHGTGVDVGAVVEDEEDGVVVEDDDTANGKGKGKAKEEISPFSTSSSPSPSPNLEQNLAQANSLELERAHMGSLMQKGRNEGEAVAKEDLWGCIFGHVRRGEGEEGWLAQAGLSQGGGRAAASGDGDAAMAEAGNRYSSSGSSGSGGSSSGGSGDGGTGRGMASVMAIEIRAAEEAAKARRRREQGLTISGSDRGEEFNEEVDSEDEERVLPMRYSSPLVASSMELE